MVSIRLVSVFFFLLSVLFSPIMASGAAVAESNQDENTNEVERLREACNSIVVLVENFQANPACDPAAQQCIEELSTKLRKMVGTSASGDKESASDRVGHTSKVEGVTSRKPADQCKVESASASLSSSTVTDTRRKGTSSDSARNSRRSYRRRDRRRHSRSDSEMSLSSDLSSDSSSAYRSRRREKKRLTRRGHPASEDKPVSVNHLSQFFSRMDNRTMPKPEKYDLASGQPLKEFLSTFEEYCLNNYRGSKSLWTSELERFLEGSIHEAYLVLRVPGDSYSSIKKKLVKWCKDSQDVIRKDTLRKFEKAQFKPQESLRLYAARLERAFRLAYPSRNVEKSKTLRHKFMLTVPKTFRKHLATAQSIRKMNGQELTWSNVLSLASEQDAQRGLSDTVEEPEEIEVLSCAPPRRSVSLGRTGAPSDTRDAPRPFQFSPTAQDFQPSGNRNTGAARRSASAHPAGRQWRGSFFETRTCNYCKLVGHVKANCRRLNQLCLACGSADHRIATCPHRRVLSSAVDSLSGPPTVKPKTRVSFGPNVNQSTAMACPPTSQDLRTSLN